MANNVLLMGFHDLASVMSERVSTVGVQRVARAIEQATAEYRRQVDALLELFVTRTEATTLRYEQAGAGTLQPLDENGIPVPIQEAGYYDVGFPIKGGGTAYGQNRIARRLMTVEEVQRHVLASQRRDADWLIRHILAALFDNAAYTFTDKLAGSVTVRPLAITSDGVTYQRRDGSAATDAHHLGSAAVDAALLTALHTELVEHPGNGETSVIFAPTASLTTITGLTGFAPVEDPAIRPGVASDVLVAGGSNLIGPGQRVVGKMQGGSWIVEWARVPDNYLVAVAPEAEDRALAMREYPDPALQGLFTETLSPDGGVSLQVNFIRYAGFGALNRVGAAVARTNNATYAIPSGFDAPLPV